MKEIMYCCLTLLLFLSCHSKLSKNEGSNNFGDKISQENAVSLTQAISALQATDTLEVKIRGKIESVCQAKGCWMNIVDADNDQSVFVKFKDYAFFVPKDASGRESIVEGKLYNAITSVDELRHYAQDEGASEEDIAAITEPEEELRMMAKGVILLN